MLLLFCCLILVLATVAHAWNSSTLGGWSRRTDWGQEFKTNLVNIVRSHLILKKKLFFILNGLIRICLSFSTEMKINLIHRWYKKLFSLSPYFHYFLQFPLFLFPFVSDLMKLSCIPFFLIIHVKMHWVYATLYSWPRFFNNVFFEFYIATTTKKQMAKEKALLS